MLPLSNVLEDIPKETQTLEAETYLKLQLLEDRADNEHHVGSWNKCILTSKPRYGPEWVSECCSGGIQSRGIPEWVAGGHVEEVFFSR